MKKFLKWFKNSTKIKRWIFLILLGIVLTCFGFSKIMVSKELEILGLIEVIISFVLGFTFFVVGIVYIQRRTLELLVEGKKAELTKFDKEANIIAIGNSIYEKGPNIVVIGGGTGLNNVLKGLKKYTSNITAIVTVSSYGQEANASRKELHLKPIQEIKESMIALASNSNEMSNLMEYNFNEGKLKGFSFGDILLSAMEKTYGDFANSIEKSRDILSIIGKVLPVTLDEMKICAELKDGTVIEQKEKIVEIVSDRVTKIHRVYINPSNCRTTPGVIEAIKNADAIIIGPGSLYTNVIPNLLIKNVSKTIRESKGLKIYVSNIMTDPGQTDDYDVSNHIQAITEHSGDGIIEFCISDVGEIVPEYIRKYNLMGSNVVNIDSSEIRNKNVRVIQGSLATIENGHIRHDPDETAKLIIELICTDLKFKDKHSDEQYILLNSKLKENKNNEKNKKGRRLKTKEKKSDDPIFKRASKFTTKYKERIKSIKESEKTRQENLKIHKKAQKLIDEEEQREKEKFLKETYEKHVKK